MTTTESTFDSLSVQQDANSRISVDEASQELNLPVIGNGTSVIYNYSFYNNCTSPLDNVNFQDAKIVGSLLPLGVVCLMVILGNIMVITAVKITHKLRGATNMFIVSLAWADLMLGILVLPFSAMYEVFNMWLFGKVWCSIWLAVDVWMCTASILHLVVISLDRYIAVTHPITYPNLMTSKKAKLLITGAWILSFVICFPPLVGWNDKDELEEGAESDLNNTSSTILTLKEIEEINERCNPQCMLNQAWVHRWLFKRLSWYLNLQFFKFYFAQNTQSIVSVGMDAMGSWEHIKFRNVRIPPKFIKPSSNPQNQEPGYVIYSAVGSFYAPMLVMMFFNWRIYQTAKKTTKAIRQGWTRVKGVSGEESIGLGIHRGGGASVASTQASAINRTNINKQTNGSSRSSGATGGVHQLTSTDSRQSSTRLVGNGLAPRDLDKVTNAAASTSTMAANSSRSRCASGNVATFTLAGAGTNNNGSTSDSPRFKRNILPQSATSGSSCIGNNSRIQREAMMPRSASSALISSSNISSSITASNNCHNSKSPSAHSYLSYGTKSCGNSNAIRSKSMANMVHRQNTCAAEVNHDEEALEAAFHRVIYSPPEPPKVSHHQPCPNHVGGKTFAEIGTQTLPKKKLEQHSSNGGNSAQCGDDGSSSSLNTLGCAAGIKQRLRLVKSSGEQNNSEPDCDSLGSAVTGQNKSSSCFRCHPRRWRHQACCFRRAQFKNGSKKSSFGRSARIGRGDADSDPGSLLNTSTHELQVIPLGSAVASMISSVVNQSASIPTSGGKIQPPRNTFGKRNIKNQVRRFRMETKAAKTLGIIVGCFICCWFPFFTIYLGNQQQMKQPTIIPKVLVRRFRMETKAAKTLGIIVGCFICCWFPFFTMYLVTAFCADCIPKLAFSIIFWLGYCNSAINPFIYAAFSRDFRGAFKKIICKILCRRSSQEPPRGIFMALHPRNVSLGVAAVAVAAGGATQGSVVTGGSLADPMGTHGTPSVRERERPHRQPAANCNTETRGNTITSVSN